MVVRRRTAQLVKIPRIRHRRYPKIGFKISSDFFDERHDLFVHGFYNV
jgi:hypothetical protein